MAASSDHFTGADVAEPPAKRASRVARARAGFQEAHVRVIGGPGVSGVRAARSEGRDSGRARTARGMTPAPAALGIGSNRLLFGTDHNPTTPAEHA